MDTTLILTSIGVFFAIIIVLVVILLIAKYYLSPSGNVKVTINGKENARSRARCQPAHHAF